ncbi:MULTISPECIES: YciI family protein [unclassified Crossiella]|uniref:YciI family protein n=1 Tax=unclassified Crossiella TaxID=2620835 RepID=UPI001FFE4CF5|nr:MULTISPECIES: YciI family protein [unclassified Crossiella]MCK2236386.1 YciI family protein [Crossiella sp. S99.2]MCK2250053.1 YciI family protein [Crossiella sp. S99.1]
MARFVVEWVFGTNRDERLAVRPAHREWAAEQAKQGVLLAGGPWANDTGAQVVLEAADRDELAKILDSDPYASADVIAETRIREWTVVTGAWITG